MKKLHIMKKKWVGKTVCCCDLKHRTIVNIDRTGFAEMDDKSTYDVFHCTSPVKKDNSCHSIYENMVE